MLLLAAAVLLVLSPLVAGRWPAGLLLHRWRWPALIFATLALQAVALQVSMPHALASTIHVGTYGVALVFLWLNRALAGAWAVGLGAASNGVTIALNGGVLPASPGAVAAAGLVHPEGFNNSAVLADPVLPWLGDVFAWPAPLPLANTFSVGDVLIVLGVALATWTATERLGRLPQGPGAGSPTTGETAAAGRGTPGA